MSVSNFDVIAQELLKQKQTMDQMEQENRELRRQLAELREGHGIWVEIDGQRFSLYREEDTASSQTPTVEAVSIMSTATPTTVEPEPQVEPVVAQHDIAEEQTEELVMSVPQTPRVTVDFLDDKDEVDFFDKAEVAEQTTGPTFLEEAIIDEFAAAATSPLAIWPAHEQEQEKTPEATEDEELATLRRQLIGSYLLE